MINDEYAPGQTGRPDLLCVAARGGLSVHLYNPTEQQVLGGCAASDGVTAGPAVTPFALNGCRRCARTAAQRGYTIVVGCDGDITLDGFVPFSAL